MNNKVVKVGYGDGRYLVKELEDCFVVIALWTKNGQRTAYLHPKNRAYQYKETVVTSHLRNQIALANYDFDSKNLIIKDER